MIDFRYHLVSIVSIFMALAVGIVLGAGPLQGQIGDTLNQEVTQLREDRTALRAELDQARKAGDVRDEFTEAATPRMVGGTLRDTTVALVTLPEADADNVSDVVATLEAAGARIVSRTTVNNEWVPADDKATDAVNTLAKDLRGSLGLPAAGAADTSPLDDVLATSLVEAEGAEPTDASRAALDRLIEEDYVDLDTADLERASTAVLVTNPIKRDTADERDYVATRLAGLSLAFDRAGRGAVLASDVGILGFSGASSVVRAARSEAGTARLLSTVDNVGIPMGQVSVVWALAQQVAGGVGQYGLSDGVSAGFPPVPAS